MSEAGGGLYYPDSLEDEDAEEKMTITLGDGPGNMPLGRVMQIHADMERKYG